MQKSNQKNGIQDKSDNSARKVNKKVTNKMSKNQKAAASSSTSPPDNYQDSPQNARLDTSESEEESVSEVMDGVAATNSANFVAQSVQNREQNVKEKVLNFDFTGNPIGHHFMSRGKKRRRKKKFK